MGGTGHEHWETERASPAAPLVTSFHLPAA
jgi:hypothetical protein